MNNGKAEKKAMVLFLLSRAGERKEVIAVTQLAQMIGVSRQYVHKLMKEMWLDGWLTIKTFGVWRVANENYVDGYFDEILEQGYTLCKKEYERAEKALRLWGMV